MSDYQPTNPSKLIAPLLIIFFGTIFSGGDPAIILMSIFVGGFIYLIMGFSYSRSGYLSEEARIRNLEELVYRISEDVAELKEMKGKL